MDKKTITIFGNSDDCIEIEGDFTAEEPACGDKPRFLHFDDGTIVKVTWCASDGMGWEVGKVGGPGEVVSHEVVLDGGMHYTDKLTIRVASDSPRVYGSADGPTESDIEDFCELFDPSELSDDQRRSLAAQFYPLAS